MTAKHVCEYCHGVLTGSRRVSLELCIEHHLESCPAAHKIKKPPKLNNVPVARKRIIPRQALDDTT